MVVSPQQVPAQRAMDVVVGDDAWRKCVGCNEGCRSLDNTHLTNPHLEQLSSLRYWGNHPHVHLDFAWRQTTAQCLQNLDLLSAECCVRKSGFVICRVLCAQIWIWLFPLCCVRKSGFGGFLFVVCANLDLVVSCLLCAQIWIWLFFVCCVRKSGFGCLPSVVCANPDCLFVGACNKSA